MVNNRVKGVDKKKRSRAIGLRIDEEMYAWLLALAKERGHTISSQAEHLLRIARMTMERTSGDDRISVVREKLAEYGKK